MAGGIQKLVAGVVGVAVGGFGAGIAIAHGVIAIGFGMMIDDIRRQLRCCPALRRCFD